MKTMLFSNSKILPGRSRGTVSFKSLAAIAVKFSSGLSLACILNSCAPCYYAPNMQNVPLLQEKNDFRASGSLKLGSYTMGGDFQIAVASTDHFGIIVNYSYSKGRNSLVDETELSDSKIHMGEFGMGYYNPFGGKFVFETYAGCGIANIKTAHDSYLGYTGSTVNSWSLFLQPAIGVHKKNIELAYSTRFRMMDFNTVEIDYSSHGQPDNFLTSLDELPMTYMLEPAFTFRAGGEKVKFHMQVGISLPLNSFDYLDYDPFNLNFGVILNIKGKKSSEAAK